MDLQEVLERLGIHEPTAVVPFQNAEDGSDYKVWKVDTGKAQYVLKKAKGCELAVYASFFSENIHGAPRFYKSASVDGGDYFLMEYVEGEDLCRCSRESLTAALDALISLQAQYWENRELESVGHSFEQSLVGRQDRGKYLKDPELERAYEVYLKLYSEVPRTLCHDDLLPFNVLVSGGSATIIDWEFAGLLPYPTSLVRLIAHGSEEKDAFFYMKEDDKSFAIEYYYENLVKEKGISYEAYRHAADYFLLYEYCEWIMLGNKYEDADMERYESYCKKAKEHLRRIL